MSNKNHFEVLTTKDGSPTVSVSGGEPMHSLAGALSESIYNYAPTISWALEQPQSCIHSIGLGLGYNEILCYALADSQNQTAPHVISFEKEDLWISSFKDWMINDIDDLKIYDAILRAISDHYQLECGSLKGALQKAFQTGRLQLLGPLETPFPEIPRAHGVLYDAYSSQTDPHLWEKDFLSEYFQKMTAPSSQVSTYAATGDLKRALESQGFKVQLRRGFGKKRNSTLAQRRSTEPNNKL